jgi:adenosylcobinamide kinase/adenosylcobinamide-phosphate guanylyltransferase
VGQGIIPMNKLSRRFVDEAGRLHQEIAKIANHVTWVVAGLPQTLKYHVFFHELMLG